MEQVLISQRNTRFTMRMSLLNLFVMPVAFYFMARWKGPSGVAASWVMLAPFTVFPLVWKVATTIQARKFDLAGSLLPAISGSVVMVAVLFGLRVWLARQGWPAMASLVVQVATGGIAYGAVLLGLFRFRILRYVRFLRGMRQDSELLPVGL
jgi:hypothetical protein